MIASGHYFVRYISTVDKKIERESGPTMMDLVVTANKNLDNDLDIGTF